MYPPYHFSDLPDNTAVRALMLWPKAPTPVQLPTDIRIPFLLDITCSTTLRDFATFLITFIDLLLKDNDSREFKISKIVYACGFRSIFGVLYVKGDLTPLLRRQSMDAFALYDNEFGVYVVSWPFDDAVLCSSVSVRSCLSMAG
jgi:hypothetical protein